MLLLGMSQKEEKEQKRERKRENNHSGHWDEWVKMNGVSSKVTGALFVQRVLEPLQCCG